MPKCSEDAARWWYLSSRAGPVMASGSPSSAQTYRTAAHSAGRPKASGSRPRGVDRTPNLLSASPGTTWLGNGDASETNAFGFFPFFLENLALTRIARLSVEPTGG